MTSTQRTLFSLLAMAAALAASGCGREPAGNDAAAPVESVAEADQASAAQAPALPKRDYWKLLGPSLAGDYSGPCMRITGAGGERKDMAVSLAADGKYTFSDHAGNLLDSTTATINRSRNEDGSMGLVFSAIGNNSAFSLATGPRGVGSQANLTRAQGVETFACEAAKHTVALNSKPLHVTLAPVLEQPSQKIDCMMSGKLVPASVDFQLKNGVLTVGQYTYELAGMREMITLENGFSTLSYIALNGDSDSVSVTLNESGTVELVSRRHEKDGMMTCTHES